MISCKEYKIHTKKTDSQSEDDVFTCTSSKQTEDVVVNVLIL